MAVDDAVPRLLSTLTDALESATTALPDDPPQCLPPDDGISLLDLKNDLLLAYLQNLVFLVILKLRDGNVAPDLRGDVVSKLVELRVYLERGVRPLENKLKYQIDKVVRAADDAERRASQKQLAAAQLKKKALDHGSDNDNAEASDLPGSGSESGDSTSHPDALDAEMSLRPRPAALVRNTDAGRDGPSPSKAQTSSTGAYKPPRINPTAMPDMSSRADPDRRARERRSHLLDEYIDEELSSAPRAQPSIGSNKTILDRGRGGLSARDRDKERERIEYEERNFVRLPAESKAERRKARLRGERDRRDVFGGEDWTGLGGLGDRIHQSVAGKARGERANVLERRDKRRRETQDGARGDGSGGLDTGTGIGDHFEKRRKIMQHRADKKANRRKG